MNSRPVVVGILTSIGLLLAACGVDPAAGTTPTPTKEPEPTATPVPSEPLEAVCFATEAYSLEHLVAVIGSDRVPTRFDGINGGGCEFNFDLTEIRVTLNGKGGSQTATFVFPNPTSDIGVPLDDSIAGAVIDASLTPGLYERTVVAVATDGRTTTIDGFDPVILVHDPDSVQAQLLRAESRWQRSGVKDYSYVIQWQCFCVMEAVAPVAIDVVDGVVTSIRFADDARTGDVPYTERFGLMERAFELIQDAIDEEAVSINVEFDQQTGYPTSTYIDYVKMIADEEQGFTITRLVIR